MDSGNTHVDKFNKTNALLISDPLNYAGVNIDYWTPQKNTEHKGV